MKDISREFIRFLKDNGYYRKYIRNFNDTKIGVPYHQIRYFDLVVKNISLKKFLNDYHPYCFVDGAFDLNNSKETKNFWINVEKEWVSLACGIDW